MRPLMNTPLTALEYYNLVRERLEHEDNLIVQRLTWLVGSQSFLFTAYAIVSNGLMSPPQLASAHLTDQLQLLFQLIPIVAMLTCILIYISILAAVVTMRRLRNGYRSRFGPEEDCLAAHHDRRAGPLVRPRRPAVIAAGVFHDLADSLGARAVAARPFCSSRLWATGRRS